jgi:hypothetical protein
MRVLRIHKLLAISGTLFGVLGLSLVDAPDGAAPGDAFLLIAGLCFLGAYKIRRLTAPPQTPFVDDGLDRSSHEPDL